MGDGARRSKQRSAPCRTNILAGYQPWFKVAEGRRVSLATIRMRMSIPVFSPAPAKFGLVESGNRFRLLHAGRPKRLRRCPALYQKIFHVDSFFASSSTIQVASIQLQIRSYSALEINSGQLNVAFLVFSLSRNK